MKIVISTKDRTSSVIPLTPNEEQLKANQEKEWKVKNERDLIVSEILKLEGLETPRRLAEAILSEEGLKWLQNNRSLIEVERNKLKRFN